MDIKYIWNFMKKNILKKLFNVFLLENGIFGLSLFGSWALQIDYDFILWILWNRLKRFFKNNNFIKYLEPVANIWYQPQL